MMMSLMRLLSLQSKIASVSVNLKCTKILSLPLRSRAANCGGKNSNSKNKSQQIFFVLTFKPLKVQPVYQALKLAVASMYL